MRILFTSDWHVDAVTAGVSRFLEAGRYLNELVLACDDHDIDLVCFLGDAFDPGSMFDGQWSAFMIEAHHRLVRAARHGAVFITGNHDVLDASVPLSTLSPLAKVSELYSSGFRKCALVAEMPKLIAFPDVAILALPYVSRGVFRTDEYADAFTLAMSDARAAKRDGLKVVSIGHYALPGIVPGSEEEMMRGRDIPIPARDLIDVGVDLVVNGHYHARQTIKVDGLQVEVVGAPSRFTFGEARDGERGFLIAEV